jgi:hypothetical protein
MVASAVKILDSAKRFAKRFRMGGTAPMARPRNTVPAYRKHSQTGRAAVSIYRTDGTRTEIVLPGTYGSEQSKQEYERLLAQLRANGGRLPVTTTKKDITVAELVLKFMQHAETYYVDPATKENTSEFVTIQAALRPLSRLYADAPAAEFGPLALQSLRSAMASGTWLTEKERSRRIKENRQFGLARSTLNKNINRIKLVFKWAASVELIPARGSLRRSEKRTAISFQPDWMAEC